MDSVAWSAWLATAGAGLVALAALRRAKPLGLVVVGVAGLVSGLMGLVGAAPLVVLTAFLVVVLVGGVLAWRWQALLAEGSRLPPGAGATRLMGMPGLVEVDVPGQAARATRAPAGASRGSGRGPLGVVTGRVRVGGEVWRAETLDAKVLPAGAAVVVTGVRGTRLVVTLAPTEVPLHPSSPTIRES